ncbi:hypothetical protein [Derxia gummosa]|uniref:Uncharacterized protein n=1 Tax=Derxia gummosa DSM 723 TaxID=1121388 RepID=A0A8B6X457_9BURK|nr:hypothetical protein [Derxia gummosa]
MTHPELWIGSFDQLLRHDLTGCRHAARRAALMLERLIDSGDLDAELRSLCEAMTERLLDRSGVPA